MRRNKRPSFAIRGGRWLFVLSSLPSLSDNAAVNEQPFIEVTINGEARQFAAGSSVTDLVIALELTAGRLAIELNLSILPRAAWPETRLQAGDKLEIVHFVGGG
ncbi:MAG: sulfur carrier protein ThiS [Blastocatellia bacterium]